MFGLFLTFKFFWNFLRFSFVVALFAASASVISQQPNHQMYFISGSGFETSLSSIRTDEDEHFTRGAGGQTNEKNLRKTAIRVNVGATLATLTGWFDIEPASVEMLVNSKASSDSDGPLTEHIEMLEATAEKWTIVSVGDYGSQYFKGMPVYVQRNSENIRIFIGKYKDDVELHRVVSHDEFLALQSSRQQADPIMILIGKGLNVPGTLVFHGKFAGNKLVGQERMEVIGDSNIKYDRIVRCGLGYLSRNPDIWPESKGEIGPEHIWFSSTHIQVILDRYDDAGNPVGCRLGAGAPSGKYQIIFELAKFSGPQFSTETSAQDDFDL